MMAAIAAAESGAEVTIIEKNEKPGKKIYITGKGRCNLTNACAKEELFEHIVTNRKFLYSAINSFDNRDVCTFFEERGLKLKTERGNRVFPLSDKSSDVIKVLSKECERLNVKILLNTEVTGIEETRPGSDADLGSKEVTITSDAVIIATGGITYPTTGSTGDGYVFAAKEGHNIIEPIPSLMDIYLAEDVKELQGLSLRNVTLKIINKQNGKLIFEEFGEMLFTDKGISGPLVLKATGVCGRELKENNGAYKISIDMKPALEPKKLDERILRDFGEAQNKNLKNAVVRLMPSSIIDTVIKKSGLYADAKVNSLKKEDRKRLSDTLKELEFEILSPGGAGGAVITKGGVDVKNINPKTMESKIKKHLYFAGEVIDADALTGGFNLQIAFSTGHAAGSAAGKEDYETDSDRWTCRCRKKHNSKGAFKKA